jgi:hypothetical protein
MKHLFFFILFAFAANATAQDSSKQNTLQHSIAVQGQNFPYNGILWGLRYDARLCTPNPLIDWSFGAASSYNTGKNTFKIGDSNFDYWSESKNYLTLHGLVLIGKKDVTFQTGLAFSMYDSNVIITEKLYYNNYDIVTQKKALDAALFAPIGVRYQPKKLPIIAWFDTGVGLYTNLNTVINTTNLPTPKGDAFLFNLQLGIGYSFAPRATTIH